MRSLGPHGGGGVTANAYELLKYVDMCRTTDFNFTPNNVDFHYS